MRILYLANVDSIHTIKWLRHAILRGHEVHAASFAYHQKGSQVAGVTYHMIDGHPNSGYLLRGYTVRRLVRQIGPDVLHAHYASGYGTLGAAAGFHPYILSAWGSDVYEFPERSLAHRMLVVRNLMSADCVCSTSRAMADRIRGLAPRIKRLVVTPFGVDTRFFAPEPQTECRGSNSEPACESDRIGALPRADRTKMLTIGTVKSLAWTYGVDILIRAFAILVKQYPMKHLRLVIAGDGPDHSKLRLLAESLEVSSFTTFVGHVPHENVPALLRQMDIFVAASRRESFGVSVLEAESCGLPVVVSDTGGLPEVVLDGRTGFIVPVGDERSLADKLGLLVEEAELRHQMGRQARDYACRVWDWSITAKMMDQVYDSITGDVCR